MKRKRYGKETYIGLVGAIVVAFIIGVIVVERVAEDMIAAHEGRATMPATITVEAAHEPAPLLEPSYTEIAAAMPEPTPTPTAAPEETATPVRSGRYAGIELAAGDYETLARLAWLEARGEPFEGQVAVVEVVFNRILSPSFPDTVDAVVYQTEPVVQFSPARYIPTAEPTETQYRAVAAALAAETPLTAADVVYFSTEAQNDRVYTTIGNHVFCRE